MKLDRQLARCKFNDSAGHYQGFARLQQDVGRRLLAGIQWGVHDATESATSVHGHWLDVGCGPGSLWQLLSQQQRKHLHLWGLDLASNMLLEGQHLVPNCAWINGDMNHLPLAKASMEGIVSSFALHWSENWQHLLTGLVESLKSNGLLAFAVPVEDSFFELGQSWQRVDGRAHQHAFPATLEIWEILKTLPVSLMQWQQGIETMRFTSVYQLVQTLRGLGVTNSRKDRSAGLITPRRWRQFESAYEHLRTKDGFLPLSYRVLWVYAKKLAN